MRILLPLLLAAMVLLTVCASSGRDGADQTASAPADGLVIRLDELTDEISFVDYMSGSTASRFICPRGWAGSWPGWGRLRGRVRPRWKRQIKPTPRDRASAPDRFRRRAAGLTSSDLAALGHLPQRGRLRGRVRPHWKRQVRATPRGSILAQQAMQGATLRPHPTSLRSATFPRGGGFGAESARDGNGRLSQRHGNSPAHPTGSEDAQQD